MAWDILVKPQFDNGGGGIVSRKPGKFIVRGPNGEVLDTVTAGGQKGTDGYKAQSSAIRKGLPPGSTIEAEDGTSYQIQGSDRHEFSYGNPKATLISGKGAVGSSRGGASTPSGGGYQPGSTFGGGFGGGQAIPIFTDAASLAFQGVSVPAIPVPNYQIIDPQVYAQQVGAQNRGEYLTNLGLSQAAALGFANIEAQGTRLFAPQQSVLQQQLVGQENQFNQGQVANANRFNPGQVSAANRYNQNELDTAINSSGLPIREVITEGLERARQLAKGFLPTSIEDRAFEQAARSKAGGDAVSKGLGTSSFAQNAIDKYTIGERLNLAQYGSNEVDKYLSQGVKLLIDSPIKYNPLLSSPLSAKTSQDIRGSTSFSVGGAQQAEQGNINQLTMLTPGASLSLYDQQKQYRAQLENNVNQFNSNMSFNTQTFNSNGNFLQQLTQLGVDQTNAGLATNFAQNTANYVNQQYQQQLAQYAQSQGFSANPYVPQTVPAIGTGAVPGAPLGQNPSTSPVYRQ